MDSKINKIIIDTLLPYKPKEIAVFGSYARNKMTGISDIDILVDLDEDVSSLDMGGMYMDLSERLNRNIDLVTKGGLNNIFKKFIEEDLKVIYRAK